MQNRLRPILHARSRFLVIGIILAFAVSAQATTRTVTSLSDVTDPNDGVLTLREAIAASGAGDTINFAPSLSGGAIHLDFNGELVIGRDLTIVGPDGGLTIERSNQYLNRILRVTAGSVSLSNCTITGGSADGTPGVVGNSSFGGGAGGDGLGGGILNSGTLTLTNCHVIGNHVYGGRGGNGYNGTTTYSFGGSGGAGFGGGIYNEGTLILVNSTVEGNSAYGGSSGNTYAVNNSSPRSPSGGPGGGGGVYNDSGATLTMLGCTLNANVARASGGTPGQNAVYGGDGGFGIGGGLVSGGTSSIANCTFSSNVAQGGDGGARGPQVPVGGISPDGGGGQGTGGGIAGSGMTLTNCTLSDNRASAGEAGGPGGRQGSASGGGVEVYSISMGNTVVAGNTVQGPNPGGPDVDGTITSRGHNLIGKIDGSQGWVASDLTGTAAAPLDPQLFPLASNGGPTKTSALSLGSVAIDAGDDAVLSSPYNLTGDQRGRPRHAAAHVDIGAYELQAPTNFVVTNTNDSGAGSLRQAVADANDEGQLDAITFDIPASDPGYDGSTKVYSITLTSGELAITNPVRIDGGNAHVTVGRSEGVAPFRLFNVSASGVTLANLFLRNGEALGGPNAPGLGGGVFNSGGLTLLNCTFSGNTATGGIGAPQLYQGLPGGEGLGGAVCNDGTLVMTNCTLSGNSVQGGAGGFGYSSNGITGKGGNGGNGRGGGLFSNQGPVTLINCTFTKNTALGAAPGAGDTPGYPGSGVSGGALFASGDTTVRNSILSGNTAAVDPNYSGTVDGKDNLIGGTPKLDSALKYNGGPTPTIALLVGSPAINAGDDATAPDADQRGYPRVGVSDVGSFEFGSALPTPTPKPTATATPKPTPTATPKSTPRTVLANISTRLKVETGDNTLIGGFIVTGTQPKKVIIRAIGPSLTIPGKLANPTLELRNSSGALLKANDDWKNSSPADRQAIIDSTIPPSNDLESAIVATLPANNSAYTAIVRGANNTTGIGVVEMYDLDRNVDSKLANISTRGLVQRGDTVLIAGTIVLGPSSQKVIIRAIGPSLNIPGKLANPTLELRNGSGTLLDSNDDWKKSPDKQAIIDSTVPPTNDLESAIVATLPGNGASYTAIVRGVNNTTGIAVVEVYALQ